MWPKKEKIYCFLFLLPSLGLKHRTRPLRGVVLFRLGGDRTRPTDRVGACLEDVREMGGKVRGEGRESSVRPSEKGKGGIYRQCVRDGGDSSKTT